MSGRVKRAALAALAELRAERDRRWAPEIRRENRGRMGMYILEGREVIAAPFDDWSHWFERAPARIVEQTQVADRLVSTVFLGIDHQFFGDGPPLVFETMVFEGPSAHNEALFQCRWSTYAEAEAGHAYTVALVEAGAPLVSPSDAAPRRSRA